MTDVRGRAARLLLDWRDLRAAVFAGPDGEGLGDPAWDMLLELIAAEDGARVVSKAELLDGTSAPTGSAPSYLSWLISRGLVACNNNEVGLLPRGRELMNTFLSQLAPPGGER